MKTVNTEKYRSKGVDIFSIKIIPNLAITIESSATVYVDVVSSKFEERSNVLETKFERIGLPVVCIVAKQNG